MPRVLWCMMASSDNLAPRVNVPIPDQDALPDWPFNFTIAPGTITDADFGDVITCYASVSGARARLVAFFLGRLLHHTA